jgi:hypothetical protein
MDLRYWQLPWADCFRQRPCLLATHHAYGDHRRVSHADGERTPGARLGGAAGKAVVTAGYGNVQVERRAFSVGRASARADESIPGKLPEQGIPGEIYRVENLLPDGSLQTWEFTWGNPRPAMAAAGCHRVHLQEGQ